MDKKTEYGSQTEYGWEIDHLQPVSKGGDDTLGNLYPLHWKNYRSKGDSYPQWKSSVTSSGAKNIESEQSWKVV